MKSEHFLKEGFVEDASEVHADHEVQMARSDLFHAAEDALVLHKLLRNISEQQGLEGWVAAKITLASDYLKTVREYIEYELMTAASEQPMLPIAEGSGSKEKQKTPYRDINSAEYRAAADKQKQRMAKDAAAEPGKKLADKIAKKDVTEGLDPTKKRRLYDLIELYRDATEPNDYYDRDIEDPDEVIAMIRSEFGDKIADQVAAGAEKMHYPRHSGYRSDPLGWKKPVDRITKAGKMYKQDSDYMKNTIKSRYKLSGKSATEGVAEGSEEKQSFKVSYHNPKTRQDKVVTIKAPNKDEVLDYCANKGYKNVHVEQGVSEDDSAVQAFLSKGGKIQQLPYKKPRKADKTDYGSKHIGGSGDKMKASRTGTAAKTQGNKVAGMSEGSACNHTMEGKSCPTHGLKECPGYKSSIEETTAGSVAGVVNPTPKNKAKVGTLFGGTYKQKKTK